MYLLRDGLQPFVRREFINHHHGRSPQELRRILNESVQDAKERFAEMDVADLLKVMERSWTPVFQRIFDRGERNTGRAERGLVLELQDVRNRSAHQRPFSDDDAYRALDSTYRLLLAVGAPEASEAQEMKKKALATLWDEQTERQISGPTEPPAEAETPPPQSTAVPTPESKSAQESPRRTSWNSVRRAALKQVAWVRGKVQLPSLAKSKRNRPGYTTEEGYVNRNQQENLGRVVPGRRNPDNRQSMHRMKCRKCSREYYRWAGDIFQSKCPYCGGGVASLDPSE